MAAVMADAALVTHSVLSAVLTAPVWEGQPVTDLVRRLVTLLNDDELEQLPAALGRTALVVEGNEALLDVVLDAVATFDAYEALPDLVRLAASSSNRRALVTAAAIAANPGVDDHLYQQVRRQVAEAESPSQQASLFTRLAPPQSAPEGQDNPLRRLTLNRWPGLATSESARRLLTPQIAIDGTGARPKMVWSLACELVRAGASIRRVPEAPQRSTHDDWIAPWVPIVTWAAAHNGADAALQSRLGTEALEVVRIGSQTLTSVVVRRMTEQINAVLHRFDVRQLRALDSTLPLTAEFQAFHPDVLRQGAFEQHEMAYLCGYRRRKTVHAAMSKLDFTPVRDRTIPYYSFKQLVALRVWRWASTQARGKLSPDFVPRLEAFAGADTATSIGLTYSGELLVDEGAGYYNARTDQLVLPDLTLDQMFESFTIGSTVTVPRLLQPSNFTTVNPLVLGGSPTLAGRRLSAEALASLHRGGGNEAVLRAYPELEEEQSAVEDAIHVGLSLQAV